MLSIINELKENNSSNYKLEVLKKHKDNELFKRILIMTYDPRINYYQKKIPNYIETDTIYSLEVSLDILMNLSNRHYTGNEAIKILQSTLGTLTREDAEIIKLIIQRDLKVGISSTSINKIIPNLIYSEPYLGCKSFNKKEIQKTLDEVGYVFSEIKMDGMYANLVINSKKEEIRSRAGTPLVLGNKFKSDLQKLEEAGYSNSVLMGELIIRGISRYDSNGIINSIRSIHEKGLNQKDIESFNKKNKHNFYYCLSNLKIIISVQMLSMQSMHSLKLEIKKIMRNLNLRSIIVA